MELPVAFLRCAICHLCNFTTTNALMLHINGYKHKYICRIMYELEKSKLSKLREQVQMQEKPGKELCKMCSIKVKNLVQHKETNLHKKLKIYL